MAVESEYVAPEVLEITDDDDIHEDMLSNLPDDIDKTEGGFAYDFTRPAALEKAEMMIMLNEAVQLFFPEWSYGVYLDSIAASVGLTRKNATAAETTLAVTGTADTLIPAGFLFSTTATDDAENIEFEVVEDTTIGSGGTAAIFVRCTEAGVLGNVPQNSIVLMSSPMDGIDAINNPEAATGGTDEEDDDELRERIKERDQEGESSFVGNNADYKRWAGEVDGVGSVIVIPEWEGAGTGTVKLVVMDSAGAPATQTIRTNVYNHIMSPDDPDARLAPVGAILTVDTASLVDIDIVAELTLADGTAISDVRTELEAALQEYFEEAKDEGASSASGISYIRYTRVGGLLSGVNGVVDYSGLTLNEDTANIAISADEYPAIGTITLTEAST